MRLAFSIFSTASMNKTEMKWNLSEKKTHEIKEEKKTKKMICVYIEQNSTLLLLHTGRLLNMYQHLMMFCSFFPFYQQNSREWYQKKNQSEVQKHNKDGSRYLFHMSITWIWNISVDRFSIRLFLMIPNGN